MLRIGRAVVRVDDLDGALAFYERAFGFGVLFDRELFPGFRSVHVGPGGAGEPGLWLFPVESVRPDQEPALVLYTDSFDTDTERARNAGARVRAETAGEPGSRSVNLLDPWGNVIVLAEV